METALVETDSQKDEYTIIALTCASGTHRKTRHGHFSNQQSLDNQSLSVFFITKHSMKCISHHDLTNTYIITGTLVKPQFHETI